MTPVPMPPSAPRFPGLLACVLTLASALVCSGAPQATRVVRASFYAFRIAAGQESVHAPTGAESTQEIGLSPANIVGSVNTALAGDELVLFRSAGTPDKPAPVAGRVRVPAGWKNVLVLLLPSAPEADVPYRCLALAQDDLDFPLGSCMLVNLTSSGIRGRAGPATVSLDPGAIKTFQPTGQPGESVPVRFERLEGREWLVLTETRWAVRRDRRQLICVYQDERTHRFLLRSLPDRTIGIAPAAPP